jgi:predicted nucleotidyltransferase component of viral defense system
MLDLKQVNHYAQASRVDSLVAERDVVLTYVLRVLEQQRLLHDLAFKGGTCMKKVYFGKTGRFSMDLDFTSTTTDLDTFKSQLTSLLHERTYNGISFRINDEWESKGDSYGAVIGYSHEWNSSTFEIEVSFREKPILPVVEFPILAEVYFRYCGFEPFEVPCLQKVEVLAEKIRASFQRLRARDLFDLYQFAVTPGSYDMSKVRALAVIKCWNSKDPFDPNRLIATISNEKYDWNDLQRLVRPNMLAPQKQIVRTVLSHYKYLTNLDRVLKRIVADSKSHKDCKFVAGLEQQLAK